MFKTSKFINNDKKIPFIPEERITNLDFYDSLWIQYYNLIEKKAKKTHSIKEVTLLFISDLHNDRLSEMFLNKITEASHNVDGCILLGDISEENLRLLLNAINSDIIIYGILGNHDRYDLYEGTRIIEINKRTVIIKDVVISGINGSIKYNNECENVLSHYESINECKMIPPADIIVSHDIPYCPNWKGSTSHKGMIGITQYMYSYGTLFNIHGHLHNSTISILPKNNICIGIYQASIVHFKKNKYDITSIDDI